MKNLQTYDICIIGSGAGAGPVAYELSKFGAKVVVLEKGGFFSESDFSKDEIAYCRRDIFTPKLKDEYHILEEYSGKKWVKTTTYQDGYSIWNGNIVGGSSNFMSGFFHRLKPNDFKLLSTYGEIKGANIVNWPISYEELEPYYDKVEKVVGVSGEVIDYKFLEPRSSKNFPYPPLKEHPIVELFDKSCKELNITSLKTPRAILSKAKDNRAQCYYSNYCGSYACSSGAKSSSRAALLVPALNTNNLTIKANSFVKKLICDEKNQIKEALYIDKFGESKKIRAKIFVLAAQAIESSRLLLNSKSLNFPNGLANNAAQVGKNFISTGGAIGGGYFDKDNFDMQKLFVEGYFVNRAVNDWYYTDEFKGGMIEFLFSHANPIAKASKLRWKNRDLIWGKELQERLYKEFTQRRKFIFEIFTDWLPTDNSFIFVDEKYKDKYGIPVAGVRINSHPQDRKVGDFLLKKSKTILKQMRAKDIYGSVSTYPSFNIQAGGCRFGDDAKTSVLNRYCQAHDIKNLFVTDGSFMPTGGSVPFTFTIYANSFRVADYIKKEI